MFLHDPNMTAIPTYALYGEAGETAVRDWLHWETIQARSREHNYRIAPHRHDNLFQMLRLTGGGPAEVVLDHLRAEVAAPALLLVPARCVHAYRFSSDVEGVVVTLFERDFEADAALSHGPLILEGPQQAIDAALDRLLAEADEPRWGHDLAMQAHLTLLVVALRRALAGAQEKARAPDAARRHAEQFRQMVEIRFRQTRRLQIYAEALGISPTHLNRVCRQVWNRSALGIIEGRIAAEARRLLLFSSLPVKEIGAQLGYEDPAYFTRFITRILGQAPAAFRRRARPAD